MSKTEQPPFQMFIENGKMLPSSQWDEERLSTWPNGTRIRVRFVEEGVRKPIAKWFAIIGRAVKETRTPWSNAETAHKAIKQSLGIIDTGKDEHGNWYSRELSITKLSDPEVEEAVVHLMDLLYRITGVDPAEWRSGVQHIEDQPESSEESESLRTSDEAASGNTHPSTDAATLSAGDEPADGAGAGESETKQEETRAASSPAPAEPDEREMVGAKMPPVPPPAAAAKPTDITRDNLIKMLVELIGNKEITAQDKLEILDTARLQWLDKMPDNPVLVKQAFDTATRIVKGIIPLLKGKAFLKELQ